MRPQDRPKTDEQKRRFAQAYYAPPQGAMGGAITSDEGETGAGTVLPEGSCVPGSSLSSGNLASGSGTRARLCLNGVAWSADINEVDARLSISVTFGEDVWKVLQSAAGDDASIASFRDAVDFHLAEEELRVT